MQYRTLGRTGLEVSEIGFGAWAIGGSWGEQSDDESIRTLHQALDLGVNFIDTAAGYGNGHSEQLIAQVLKDRSDRDRIIVATKSPPAPGVWPPSPYCDPDERFSEQYLRENVEQRLRHLQTDRLDLLQLHTWTRAWNDDPRPLNALRKLRDEGKLRFIGVSTPEHDQNAVIQLMRDGWVDTVQVIYNIFDQEPAAQLLPVAQQTNTGIIVRVALDEGALTGKFTPETTFPSDDFRSRYFADDRLQRTIDRVQKVREDIEGSGYSLPQAAIKFAMSHPAVSTVIAGMRRPWQAEQNSAVSDLPAMPATLQEKLRAHNWRRAFWHLGK